MNRKIIIVISTLAVLSTIIGYIIITKVVFNVAQRHETICVDPQTSARAIGENFTVNINISDVTNLFGWEIWLRWNSTVLNATNVVEGSFLESGGSTFFTSSINNTLGSLRVLCALVGKVPGVSGSGTLVTIRFYVKGSGNCDLDLYNTALVDASEKSITHTTVDGRFNSIP